jgi:hypothetical protein
VSRRLAWGGLALYLALAGVGTVLNALTSRSDVPPADDPGAFATDLLFALTIGGFAVVGALVAARLPRNPVGWMLLAVSLLNGVAMFATGWTDLALYGDPGSLPAPAEVAWLGAVANDLQWGLAVLMLLLLPDGRLPSPAWRGPAALIVVLTLAEAFDTAFEPGRLEDVAAAENPFGLEALGALRDVDFDGLSSFMLLVPLAGLLVKRRRGSAELRQQLKGFLFAMAVVAVALAGLGLGTAVGLDTESVLVTSVVFLLFAYLALALGVAVLKHRLYDVDVVIRRTLVYGALTATLGAAYLGLVLLAGLAIGKTDLAIAVSTLAVAALFRPARARIQALVDRRFYRRRYDAEQTLAGFGARLRDVVELDALSGELRGVVRETVQPAHVSLWLRDAGR